MTDPKVKPETLVALLFVIAGAVLLTVGATLVVGPPALVFFGVVLVVTGALVPWERM